MSDPKKTDPQIFWVTVAGIVAMAVFAAYCWIGVYELGASPHCHTGYRGAIIC